MAITFDIESVIQSIKVRLIDATKGLNAKIGEVNTIKQLTDESVYGFPIVLKTVEDKAFFFLIAKLMVVNMDPFVSIYIEPSGYIKDDLGAVTLKISISITLVDLQDNTVDIRALRYLQALIDIFEPTRWTDLDAYFPRLSNMEPVGYESSVDGKSWREVGIVLQLAFASR